MQTVGVIGLGNMGTGMAKNLGITLSMARDSGVPIFTTSTAYQLFQAGISLRPQEDNWTIIKILEEIAGTEVKENVPLEGADYWRFSKAPPLLAFSLIVKET